MCVRLSVFCLPRLTDGRCPGCRRRQGVRLCTNPFDVTTFGTETERPPADGGFDHGLLVLDRGVYADRVPYNAVGTVPQKPPAADCSVVGLHFINLLAMDPAENAAAVDLHAEYIEAEAKRPGRIVARNSAELASQWLHHRHTEVRCSDLSAEGEVAVHIDMRGVPSEAWPELVAPLVLQLPVGSRRLRCISVAEGDPFVAVAAWEQYGHQFVSVAADGPGAVGQVTLTLEEAGVDGGGVSPVATRGGSLAPLLLRTEDTMVLRRVAPISATATAVDCVVYGKQAIEVLVPSRPVSVAAEGTEHVRVALEAVRECEGTAADGSLATMYGALLRLEALGRPVNGRPCRAVLASE